MSTQSASKNVTVRDNLGNILIIEQNKDERYGHISHLYLQVGGETRRRSIGVLDKLRRVFFVTRLRAKHLHRKSNSYGFAYNVLSKATHFDEVMLTDDEGYYLIPRKVILDEGKFMVFKNDVTGESFEKQIFLSLDVIKKYKQF